MKLPKPSAPFERLEIRGESITIDVSAKVLVIPTGNQNVLPNANEYSIYPNALEDEISLIKIDAATSVPPELFISKLGYPEEWNATITHNDALSCADFMTNGSTTGDFFIVGFYPATTCTYVIELGMDCDYGNANIYIDMSTTRLIISRPAGAYRVFGWWRDDSGNAASTYFTVPVGGFSDNKIKIYVTCDNTTRTCHVWFSDSLSIVFPYITPDARDIPYPFVINPVIHISHYISLGTYVTSHIYSIEQRIKGNTVTATGYRHATSFGIDYARDPRNNAGPAYMHNYGQCGTVWADLLYSSAENIALTKLLLNEYGWELGIHFTTQLNSLSDEAAYALIDNEIAALTAIYGTPPVSWCSLANDDSLRHAIYAYQQHGIIWRNGLSGVSWLTNIGNLHNDTWPWWNLAAQKATIYPSFTHITDEEPAIPYSIDYSKLTAWADAYHANDINTVGIYEYTKINSNQTDASISIYYEDEKYLMFCVKTNGYPTNIIIPGISNINGVYKNTTEINYIQRADGIEFLADDGVYTVSQSSGETYELTETELQQLSSSWIAIYNPSDAEIDFFLFTHRPKKLSYTRNESGTIDKLTLYPGNGVIHHGRVTFANLSPEFSEAYDTTTGSLYTETDGIYLSDVNKSSLVKLLTSETLLALNDFAYDPAVHKITQEFSINNTKLVNNPTIISDGTDITGWTSRGTTPILESVDNAIHFSANETDGWTMIFIKKTYSPTLFLNKNFILVRAKKSINSTGTNLFVRLTDINGKYIDWSGERFQLTTEYKTFIFPLHPTVIGTAGMMPRTVQEGYDANNVSIISIGISTGTGLFSELYLDSVSVDSEIPAYVELQAPANISDIQLTIQTHDGTAYRTTEIYSLYGECVNVSSAPENCMLSDGTAMDNLYGSGGGRAIFPCGDVGETVNGSVGTITYSNNAPSTKRIGLMFYLPPSDNTIRLKTIMDYIPQPIRPDFLVKEHNGSVTKFLQPYGMVV